MRLEDFNAYQQNQRMYGGTAGRKMGINYKGNDYLLKFPGNLKEQHMKNINISYSNSPVCEYIGSKIYELIGIPVHHTILGLRNSKVVVACEDFLRDGDRLYEFDKIKVTFEPIFFDSNGNETNGAGVDLYEILMTIQEHPFLQDISGVPEHFWNMFVVDAWIGNTDRNNSNWGVILRKDGFKELAPVYDNGNCLNSKWDDIKMQVVMDDEDKIKAEAYKARRCIYELHNRKINPYQLIESLSYEKCSEAVKRLVPRMSSCMEKIRKLITDIPILSEIQKQFYLLILRERYDGILLPTYQKLTENKVY